MQANGLQSSGEKETPAVVTHPGAGMSTCELGGS